MRGPVGGARHCAPPPMDLRSGRGMETTAEKTPRLLRCPKCGCAQPAPFDGRCRACGRSAPIPRWTYTTARHPVQPEERNGHACPECGDEVIVSLPSMRPSASPFVYWLILGITLGPMAALTGGLWEAAVIALAPAAGLLPLHLMYRKYGGPAAVWHIVVACRSCRFVRAGRLGGDQPRWDWRRGQAFFDGLYRKLLPVAAFFLAITIWASVTDTTTDWMTTAIVVVSTFLLFSVRWYRGAFGLRSWW